MSRRCAIRGISIRHGMGDSRLRLVFLVPFLLSAALIGCRSEASKEKAPSVQTGANAGRTEPGTSAGPGKLTIENPVIDLGEIGTDSKVSGKFTFVNTGQGTLKIVKVLTCCGVTNSGVKDGQEYAPGERGALEFAWVSVSTPQPVISKAIRVETNDPNQKYASFEFRAKIVRRVETDPTRLRLFLRQENAACSAITIRSTDGKPFSIADFKSTANTLCAQFDPNSKATEFVVKPQADIEKLRHNVRGVVSIDLTHPECGNVRLLYDVLPEYTVSPVHLMILSIRPGQPVQRDISIHSNYRDEFDVESVSSEKGYVKLVDKKKVEDHYRLRIEIVVPPQGDDDVTPSGDGQGPASAMQENAKSALVTDVFQIKVKDAETLTIPFRGFYAAE